MIPPFESPSGYLPAGVHDASWEEFSDRFGDNDHRRRLLHGLLEALNNLRGTGCETVIIGGNFVTSKRLPADYDGTWDPTNVDVDKIDPVLLTFENQRAAMKAKYLGELFPATAEAASGIRFTEFFQQDRDGEAKGVVRLDLGNLP